MLFIFYELVINIEAGVFIAEPYEKPQGDLVVFNLINKAAARRVQTPGLSKGMDFVPPA
jgi:hypothetical protein